MSCFPVTLNDLVMDGVTPDGDGILWFPQTLTGWFDSTDASIYRQPVPPVGEIVTAVHENARPIVLEAIAHSDPPSVGLGDLCFNAMETAKTAGRCLYLPVTMTVTDPALGALHAAVRRVDGTSLKTAILGTLTAVRVQWLLLAEDPRRYEADNTTSHD